MMWRRIDFLRVVLEMGYNFVFTVYFLSLEKEAGQEMEVSYLLFLIYHYLGLTCHKSKRI
ncbi:hypothetical protein R3W88_000775 [Solanum pinnatisectum]|uniref:Uncharacterized protein n=1 Tax=Solanum pinnatisectum TaxID=50273 RepID=A0AAV9MGI5_9SOLN|nr:hypothetical protein R3W88_000775 [Solanum pinnatisectum]